MPTILQEKLADEIVKNIKRKKPKNKGELLESVGYAQNTAEAKPGEIIDQQGVKDALVARGFTVENAKRVIGEIVDNPRANDGDKIRAAQEIFKVHGEYAPDKSINVNINAKSIDPTDPKVLEALKTINERLENE